MQMLHLQNEWRTCNSLSARFASVSKPMYRLTEAFPYLVTRVGVRMGELISHRRVDSVSVI
jgi:hypothetical protein